MKQIVSAAMVTELVEKLAAIEHDRWRHWQKYMHEKCDRETNGSLTIPADLVARWESQIATPYEFLIEHEKESDREQVRKYLPLILDALGFCSDA